MIRIRERREALGLSQAELGQACRPPISTAQISKLERGQRKLTDAYRERLARALRCSPAELSDEVDMRVSPEEEWVILTLRKIPPIQREAMLAALRVLSGEDPSVLPAPPSKGGQQAGEAPTLKGLDLWSPAKKSPP